MPELINLGGFSNIGGKRIATTGVASKLNTQEIIEAQLAPKKENIEKIQGRINKNLEKVNSLNELKDILNNITDKLQALRNPPGFNGMQENIFNRALPYMHTDDDIREATHYMEVMASPGCSFANHTLHIQQVAKIKSELIGSRENAGIQEGFSSQTNGITTLDGSNNTFKAGTFQINNVDIVIAENDSLISIAGKINYVSLETKTKAEIIKVSDNDFRLKLYSTETGADAAYNITDNDNVLGFINIKNNLTAQDAIIEFDGVVVQRPSNVISDIVPGLTFKLYNTNTAGKSLYLNLDPDVNAVRAAITDLAIEYNKLAQFIAKNQERGSNHQYKDTAILASEPILEQIKREFSSTIVGNILGLEGEFRSLASIGITLIDAPANKKEELIKAPNSLDIQYPILDKCLTSNFGEVQKLMELTFIAPNYQVKIYERSLIRVNDFTLKIKPSGLEAPLSSEEKAVFTYTESNIEKNIYADFQLGSNGDNAGIITGRVGTVFEGMSIYYLGNPNDIQEEIAINVTQGFADKIHAYARNYTRHNGIIDRLISNFQERNRREDIDLERKQQEFERSREKLIRDYSKLEANVSSQNQSLAYLDAHMQSLSQKK